MMEILAQTMTASSEGICEGNALCDDGISCTDDTCDLETGVTCINTLNDALCDDGISCSVDLCNALIGCVNATTDILCDDGVACKDICDSALDCQSIAQDSLCGDGEDVPWMCVNQTLAVPPFWTTHSATMY